MDEKFQSILSVALTAVPGERRAPSETEHLAVPGTPEPGRSVALRQ